jgi:hypothetical protein
MTVPTAKKCKRSAVDDHKISQTVIKTGTAEAEARLLGAALVLRQKSVGNNIRGRQNTIE